MGGRFVRFGNVRPGGCERSVAAGALIRSLGDGAERRWLSRVDTVERAEVPIEGDHATPVFDRKRSEMSVIDEVAAGAGDAEERANESQMVCGRADDHGRRRRGP